MTVDNVQGAPDLVVEIRSPSTARQDWNVKRELYARHDVKEYGWWARKRLLSPFCCWKAWT